jgi:hypothetical protein
MRAVGKLALEVGHGLAEVVLAADEALLQATATRLVALEDQ